MLAQFAVQLIFGMSLLLAIMPRQSVASGFFRVQMLIFLGLSVTATLFGPGKWPQLVAIVIAIVSFLGSVFWTLERRSWGAGCLYGVIPLSMSYLAGWGLERGTASVSGTAAEFVWLLTHQLSGGTVLGGAMTAMLLGHSYLTAPTMSIKPLSWLNLAFGGTLVVRTLLAVAGLWFAWPLIQGMTPAMWLALRWLAGILGPFAVCVMVVQILKFRNTQSATGVLFVGVILTFIGELAAMLLFQELHYPL